MDLTPFFEKAVVAFSNKKTAELGDRTQYIGSSDVAGCARKVYLQRKNPITPSVNVLLRYSRGFAAETLIENIFTAGGLSFDTQVLLKHPHYNLLAHIDFLLKSDINGTPQYHVVECKSVSSIPSTCYPNHEDQLLFQLGMLKLNYPEAEIGGSILVIDLNAGQIHQFNGYEYDSATFNYLINRGLHLLDVLNEEDEARPSPSNLCGYCSYRSDCPAMTLPSVVLPTEIEAMAGKYNELNRTKNLAEKELQALRREIMDFTGPVFRGRSDNYDLVVTSIAPSMTVDASLLKKQYPDLYPNLCKEKAGYSKLEIRPVKTAA